MNTSCDASKEMKTVTCMAMADFMFPASQISREKTRGILGRGYHLVNKKIYGCYELLANLQVDDVGLSGEP